MKPLAVDLCCGLGGFTEGLLAEGWDAVGFDIERHKYGRHQYPGQLVLQDVLTLSGQQFRGKVSLIVASPPCQKYSYMAMPWTRAKELQKWYRDPQYPERLAELNAIFDACVRIGEEAECPIIIENVRGAQKWVGRARWNYGSFYLWGDVPALMPPISSRAVLKAGVTHRSNGATNFHGIKGVPHRTKGHWTNPAEHEGVKNGNDWFSSGENCSLQRRQGSGTSARKMASAMIAKIPLPLSRHIAATYKEKAA